MKDVGGKNGDDKDAEDQFDFCPDSNASGSKDAVETGNPDSHKQENSSHNDSDRSRLPNYNDKKRQSCYFCGKTVLKIARHLLSVHSNETEVAKIAHLPIKNDQRKKALGRLKNLGNFKHNTNVVSGEKGPFIPARKQRGQVNYGDYLPCSSCFAFFKSKHLWRHQRKCIQRENSSLKQRQVQSEARTLLPDIPGATDLLKTRVISRMRPDNVTEVVKGDTLILQFGSRLLHKHKKQEHLSVFVSTKMRELGRLLIELKISIPGQKLTEFLKPQFFDLITRSVLKVSKSGEQGETPSLALKLGHSLKKCAQILKSQYLMKEDFDTAQTVQTFITLLENDWADSVSHHALEELKSRKANRPSLLPLTEDIKTLTQFLDRQISAVRKALEANSTCCGIWKELAELLMCQIIFFNRKRAGEIERLKTVSCQHILNDEYVEQNIDETLLLSLSKFEQSLVKKFTRIETRGKRGRTVAVILTPSMVKTLKHLMQTRSAVGIPESNLFVFAGHGDKPLNGYRAVSSVVKKCTGLRRPDDLTSTKLRKHIASLSQVMNLQENELDILASHMGHDLFVHREYYRLPQNILETAKVTKMLLRMENGDLQQLKGKTLDDIDASVDGGISSEEEDSDFECENFDIEKEDTEGPQCSVSCQQDKGMFSLPDCRNDTVSPKGKIFHTSPKEKKCPRRRWRSEEANAVERNLALYIANRTVPGKIPTAKCLENEPVLQARNRSWKDIKSYVHNRIMALKRSEKKKSCNNGDKVSHITNGEEMPSQAVQQRRSKYRKKV